MRHFRQNGKTLAEYALIAFLVALVSIPALTYLGTEIDAMYTGSDPINKAQPLFALLNGSGSQNGSSAATAENNPPGGANTTMGNAEGGMVSYDYTFSQAIQSSSVEGIIENLKNGGMGGVTSSLASNLDELINQLEASGDMSPEEAAHFRKLSNQGHLIADIQRTIEEAVLKFHGTPDDDNFTAFRQQKVVYQGQEMTVQQLAAMVDWMHQMPDNWYNQLASGKIDTSSTTFFEGANVTHDNGKNELGRFIDLYQDTLNFTAYQDHPELRDYVTSLSATIAYLSDMSGSFYISRFENAQEMQKWQIWELTQKAPVFALDAQNYSEITDGSSGEICGVGQGSDTGTSCH